MRQCAIAFSVVLGTMLGPQDGARAQEATAPQPVIDQCNATVDSYDDMPDCLRGGGIGYQMLEIAAGDTFYGPVGGEVAGHCAEINATFHSQWMCFRTAAEKAVEIGRMIGTQEMTDRCYRGLSDVETLTRLMARADEMRRAVVGTASWSGVTSYHAFKGCPGGEDHAHEAQGEEGHDHPEPIEDNGGFPPETCRAYAEVETAIASRSEAELRAALAALRPLPEAERLEALTAYGISQPSIAVLDQDLRGDARVGTGFLLLGLLRDTQPGLFSELIEAQKTSGNEFGEAIASGMASFLLEAVLDSYRTFCAP